MNNLTLNRKTTAGATCKCCGMELRGNCIVANATRGKLMYMHENCATITGSPLAKFNDNGGSTHYFTVTMYRPFEGDVDGAMAWAMFARSAGFSANGNANGVEIRGDVPAQSLKKLLKNLNPMIFSINKKLFFDDEIEMAMKYIQRITNGNSHN